MSKPLTVIFLAIALGGCIPLPVSLGVSGWSYLVSGRSPTDHLISQTINQDCKILRLAVGKEPCAAFANGERSFVWAVLRGDREAGATASVTPALIEPIDAVAVPAAEAPVTETSSLRTGFNAAFETPPPPLSRVSVENLEGVLIADETPAARPSWRDTASTDGAASVVRPLPRPSRRAARAADGNYALVLGSVSQWDRAARLSSRFNAHHASIVSVEVKGQTWHRVVVGPAPLVDLKKLKSTLGEVDGKRPWIFMAKQS